MKIKCKLISFAVLTLCLLWSAVYAGTAFAEIKLGGKVETTVTGTMDADNNLTSALQEHLQLEFLLPDLGDTSARFEVNMYYEPQAADGRPSFTGDVTKLYVKQRFQRFHLTVGRQPISWSFGSLLNPVDFASGQDLLNLAGGASGMSENAVQAYIPMTWASNLTLIAAYPELAKSAKLGARVRGEVAGFDLALSYLRDPARNLGVIELPGSQRIGFTGKGDLGPVGIYGAAGYAFDGAISKGKAVYLFGSDYSFELASGGKILLQTEYLNDHTDNPLKLAQPELLLGTASYEIDEFAGVSIFAGLNRQDHSMVIGPMYKNQIGKGLDISLRGALFLGQVGSQFGPQNLNPGYAIPRGMVQIGVGYTF